jgi:hypothetical protein
LQKYEKIPIQLWIWLAFFAMHCGAYFLECQQKDFVVLTTDGFVQTLPLSFSPTQHYLARVRGRDKNGLLRSIQK